jgi:hypothetical protein
MRGFLPQFRMRTLNTFLNFSGSNRARRSITGDAEWVGSIGPKSDPGFHFASRGPSSNDALVLGNGHYQTYSLNLRIS